MAETAMESHGARVATAVGILSQTSERLHKTRKVDRLGVHMDGTALQMLESESNDPKRNA